MKVWTGLTEAEAASIFRRRPALHRRVDLMPGVFHAGLQRIVLGYGGDACRIWRGTPSSAALVRRFLEFDGVGPKIATMAANILVREMKVHVADKFSIDVSVDVHVRRVFERLGLVREDASNEEIIYAAREMNPEYPGVFDLAAWEIGRTWCKATPECGKCRMGGVCPKRLGDRHAAAIPR